MFYYGIPYLGFACGLSSNSSPIGMKLVKCALMLPCALVTTTSPGLEYSMELLKNSVLY